MVFAGVFPGGFASPKTFGLRIYVLICVGLAVDYAAHIAHMFKETPSRA